MKVLLVVGMLAGCGAALPLERAAAAMDPAYCFGGTVRARDGKALAACAETPALCERALRFARKWGRAVGITDLGRCSRMVLR